MNVCSGAVSISRKCTSICGPPGRGKSFRCSTGQCWATLQGYDVLYYTLEVGRKVYEMRYHSCLTGIPMVKLRYETALFRERWEILKRNFPEMGRLIMPRLPPRFLKPSILRRDIRYFRDRGHDIKKVTVDYAEPDVFRQKASSSKIRDCETGNVYEELRGIGKEFDCQHGLGIPGKQGIAQTRRKSTSTPWQRTSRKHLRRITSAACAGPRLRKRRGLQTRNRVGSNSEFSRQEPERIKLNQHPGDDGLYAGPG